MIKEEVFESFAGKNVLVTGGTGMIGRQVVDILCDGKLFYRERKMEA
jgi:GDP-L-fucose synthase